MDQMKIGKHIALLRRQAGLTQENLGERIGVTNKTISRWETGSYTPNIEMLQLLSREFNVSIDELLAAEPVSGQDFRPRAAENAIEAPKTSAFSIEERTAFFKKKWRKEHMSLFIMLGLILLGAFLVPFWISQPRLIGIAPFIAMIEYGYQNNKMMIYIENHLYDRSGE